MLCKWECWSEFSFCSVLFSYAHFITALNLIRSSISELTWWKFWSDFLAAVEFACWISWIFWTDESDHTFLMQRMLCNSKFNSYINYACFQEFCSFLQWFAHKSAMWCHSQKCLCLINYWCCCMFSEALLCKTNREWEIKKILVIF